MSDLNKWKDFLTSQNIEIEIKDYIDGGKYIQCIKGEHYSECYSGMMITFDKDGTLIEVEVYT